MWVRLSVIMVWMSLALLFSSSGSITQWYRLHCWTVVITFFLNLKCWRACIWIITDNQGVHFFSFLFICFFVLLKIDLLIFPTWLFRPRTKIDCDNCSRANIRFAPTRTYFFIPRKFMTAYLWEITTIDYALNQLIYM